MKAIPSTPSSTFSSNVAGVRTPHGRVYCPECAIRLKVQVEEAYLKGDYSSWSITCEKCEEVILESED